MHRLGNSPGLMSSKRSVELTVSSRVMVVMAGEMGGPLEISGAELLSSADTESSARSGAEQSNRYTSETRQDAAARVLAYLGIRGYRSRTVSRAPKLHYCSVNFVSLQAEHHSGTNFSKISESIWRKTCPLHIIYI